MRCPDTCTVSIAASDGVRLAATRTGPRRSAATVVYMHGLGCDRRVWAPVTTGTPAFMIPAFSSAICTSVSPSISR